MSEIIGHSSSIIQMVERIKAVSKTNASVLITGESGVGKELVADLIHKESNRADGSLVVVNCAAIPRELFESEFFGHMKGAFTGAVSDRIGRFELADKGTLFLDEVGEIPIDLQAKFLRTLQQQSFERIGEVKTREVDIRIIAATNRNLEDEIDNGRFREDLYYRLSVFPISISPLRKRKVDIPTLAEHFFTTFCEHYDKNYDSLSEDQISMLVDYDWPGNVRELKSIIERAIILSGDKFRLDLALPEQALKQVSISVKKIAESIPLSFLTEIEFRQLERNNITSALEHAKWKISGAHGAAELLGIKSTTLTSRMKAFNIKSPSISSLYSRLGGIESISIFVDQLLPRLHSDPELGRFWRYRGVDSIRQEKQYLVEYLCDVTGGPYHYAGRHMLKAHEGLNILENDWNIFLGLLSDVASLLNIGDQEFLEINSLFDEVKPLIVGV